MTLPYVEILQDSRAFSLTRTSIEQSICIRYALPRKPAPDEDDLMDPVMDLALATFGGVTDDVLALETAYTLLPLSRWLPDIQGTPFLLVIDTVQVKQVNNYDWWEAVASYKYDINAGTGGGNDDNSDPTTLPYVQIGFAVGNNTKHITESYSVNIQARTTGGRPLPDTGLAIGVTADSIEGTDIPGGGGLTLQLTAYYYPSKIDDALIAKFVEACSPECKTNLGTFLGRAEGEVLFLGVNGSGTVVDIVPLTFDFLIKDTIVAQSDAPFAALSCEAHDYIEYRYSKQLDVTAKLLLQKPDYRAVHRVHGRFDFNQFGLPV